MLRIHNDFEMLPEKCGVLGWAATQRVSLPVSVNQKNLWSSASQHVTTTPLRGNLESAQQQPAQVG